MSIGIPNIEENPNGLYRRYTVAKNNGEPVDSFAVYFVLRLDSGGRDWSHIAACREAARAYVTGFVRGMEKRATNICGRWQTTWKSSLTR